MTIEPWGNFSLKEHLMPTAFNDNVITNKINLRHSTCQFIMRKIFSIVICIFLPYCLFAEKSNPQDNTNQPKDTTKVTVYTYVHHISDLNFRDQDYKIELWLYLTSRDTLRNSLDEQILVKEAKKLNISFIPQFWLKYAALT